MSTSTISSYHQVTRDEFASLSPDTNANIAVLTDDQSYEMYVSDGTRWMKMGDTRTTDIPYTLLDLTGSSGPTITNTPEYHLDASRDLTLFSDPQGTNANNGDKIYEWKSLTGGHTLTQLDISKQPYWGPSAPDSKPGVHMHDIGTCMRTNDENNKHLTGVTVTFAVYKPTADDINDLYRDIADASALSPIGDYGIYILGSNKGKQTGDYNDIYLFKYNHVQHVYTYISETSSIAITLPRNNTEQVVDGVGRLANYNSSFVDKRQLIVMITSHTHEQYLQDLKSYGRDKNYTTVYSTYTNVNEYPGNQAPIADNWCDYKYQQRYDGLCIGSRPEHDKNPHCVLNEAMVFNYMMSVDEINTVAQHLVNKWSVDNWYPLLPDGTSSDPETHYIPSR